MPFFIIYPLHTTKPGRINWTNRDQNWGLRPITSLWTGLSPQLLEKLSFRFSVSFFVSKNNCVYAESISINHMCLWVYINATYIFFCLFDIRSLSTSGFLYCSIRFYLFFPLSAFFFYNNTAFCWTPALAELNVLFFVYPLTE